MPPPFLMVDCALGAGACTLYRYQGASPSQVGDTFGARLTTAFINGQLRHGARQYKGNIYAYGGDGIYVKDDPTSNTGTWTQAIAFTSPTTTSPKTSGLHIVAINDEPILVCAFGSTADADWRWAKFDGTTWTQAATATTLPSCNQIQDVIVYRGVIHMIVANTNNPFAITFDPATDSFTTPTEPFALLGQSMCVFNDRLLAMHLDITRTVRLVEYSGGSWADVPAAVGHTAINPAYYALKMGLFTDGTLLYGCCPAPTDGWRVLQWPAALTAPTDISTTVLPTSLLGSGDGGTYPAQIEFGRFLPHVDQNTDPSIADIWLYQTPSNALGTPWTLWKWNGNAALITQEDSGGDVRHAMPSGLIAAGEHIWTAGEMDIWITGKTPIVGGQRVFFACGGAAGAADKIVNFRFDTENEPPLALATLIGMGVFSGSPAGAPTLGTNQVENVDADPTVVYYADWATTTDGVSDGDRAQLKPVISV